MLIEESGSNGVKNAEKQDSWLGSSIFGTSISEMLPSWGGGGGVTRNNVAEEYGNLNILDEERNRKEK
jgi:hypothetical protein